MPGLGFVFIDFLLCLLCFVFLFFSDLGLDWVLFSNTFFDAIIAFTPNKVLLRKTCFLGRKNHTSLLSIYCASGGGFAGGGRGPCDIPIYTYLYLSYLYLSVLMANKVGFPWDFKYFGLNQ